MTEPRERFLAIAAAVITVVLWASAFIGIRALKDDFTPASMTLARIADGTLVLGAAIVVRRPPLPSRGDLVRIVPIGLLWYALYNVLLNAGERTIDAGTAAMLINTGPIFIALLAGVLLREGFPRRLLAGCAVSFAGVAIIAAANARLGGGAGLGALLCLVAAFISALALVLQKPLMSRNASLQVTFLACLVGTVACLPAAPILMRELASAPTSSIGWVMYLGVFPTAIGFTTWAYALRHTSAGRLGVTTYLVPPLVVVMGWLGLGEVPPALALAGGALCLLGVAVARSGR
jgi:drug/metabolite transporter (DMT)-like permease